MVSHGLKKPMSQHRDMGHPNLAGLGQLALQGDHGAADGVAEDLAVAQGDAALGEGGHLGVVGDHDDGVALAVKILEKVGDDGLVGGVEVSGGLVGKKDRGVVDKRAGDADALLLASGELAGEVRDTVAETDALERGAGFSLVGHGVEVLREHHVFKRGEIRDQVELLKDEADLAGAEAVHLGGRHGGEVDVVDLQLAGGRAVEASDQVDQGALSGA